MRGGLFSGAVTAVAVGLVLAGLDEYQVRDYADLDPVKGLAGAMFAGIGAALVIAVVGRKRQWARTHVLVPLLVLPLVIGPLVLGLERNRFEAALLFGAVAFGIHLLVGRRRGAAGIALVVVAAGLLTWGLQQRWRAQKFEAVGVPLYVADVPGYELSKVWAGRYSYTLTFRSPGGAGLEVWATGKSSGVRCGTKPATPGSPSLLEICSPGGGAVEMMVTPDPGPLLNEITVREVDGWVLAGYPDGVSSFEPD
ncbi:hypothetical protein JIG36_43410 [Actinoplanes sp. LDG1-06]|uniref:Uncharacterized protein n=1 Tax=Paractinoplanes ovalisporus TaxID=2810368 RepID=A0ABS2AR87_9ACTN|nr:hypothetical protein [Actinoplanes ovalisporus]MBM2622372.1 hypothetical protein [Actinoplanes ovalisporus]